LRSFVQKSSLRAVATLLTLYVREGKTESAVARLSKLIEQHPRNAGLRALLGVTYSTLKQLDQAGASVRQALALDPKGKDAYMLLGP